MQGAAVLADALVAVLDPNPEVLGLRTLEPVGVARHVCREGHGQVDPLLRHPRPKRHLEGGLVRLRSGGVEHEPAGLQIDHEQVNRPSGHARRKPFDVHLHVQCRKPGHGHFFDAPHEVVVDVVGDLVDGATHEVVGAEDTELVLDFVVVIAEVARHPTCAHHRIDPGAFFLVDQELRRRFVDVHKLVRDQPPAP